MRAEVRGHKSDGDRLRFPTADLRLAKKTSRPGETPEAAALGQPLIVLANRISGVESFRCRERRLPKDRESACGNDRDASRRSWRLDRALAAGLWRHAFRRPGWRRR